MNIAFFASYNGSSAKAITAACFEGDLVASPTLLITNNPDAAALEWAENFGLKTFIVNKNTHPDGQAHDNVIADKLREHKITLAVLSGYMKLVGQNTIDAVDRKIINIHPRPFTKIWR